MRSDATQLRRALVLAGSGGPVSGAEGIHGTNDRAPRLMQAMSTASTPVKSRAADWGSPGNILTSRSMQTTMHQERRVDAFDPRQ
jgi:hypothetical protein